MRPITATVTSILVATLICACMPCAQAQPPTDCQFGKMRFFWTHAYGCIVKEPYHQFPLAAGVTHMEIAGLPFTNPPDRKQYDRLADIMKQDIAFLHGHGVKVFGYHPGTFLYGYEDAPATRPKGETGPLKKWFDFFESRWEQQYSDYFGKRPATDPMTYLQVTAAGEPIPYSYHGPAGYYFCANSPEFQTYARGIIDMMIDVGYDGCYLDSTGVWNGKGACYCDHCKAGFRELLKSTCTEEEITTILGIADVDKVEPPLEKTDDNAALWVKWQEFRAHASPDLLQMLEDYAREKDPDFAISCNYCMSWKDLLASFHGTYGPALKYDAINDAQSWGLIEHPRRPQVSIGTPGSDEFKDYGGGRYITSHAYQYRYLKAVGRDKAILMLMALGWWHTPKSPGHDNITKAWIANTHANGLVPDANYSYVNTLSPLQQEAVILYNNFWKDHSDLFVGSQMEANVGIWTSTQQAYLNQPTMCFPASQLLWEDGILFRDILDRDITSAGLAGLDALVLAHVPVISDAQYETLSEFVKAGGKLVLFGEVGTYDEWGRERDNAPLFVGPSLSDKPMQETVGKGTVAYLPRGECPISFNDGPSRWMKTGIPECERDKTTWLRRIPAALRQIMTTPQTCEVADKPVTVELTVMKNPAAKYVVQLVNFNIPRLKDDGKWWRDPDKVKQSGLSEGFIKLLEEGTWGGKPLNKAAALRGAWDPEIHPEKNLQVKLRMADDCEVSKVRLLSPDVAEEVLLDYEITEPAGGRLVSFTVPQLDIYAVAVVE